METTQESQKECVLEKPEVSIVMVGLDEAGKTTLLYKLKLGDGDLTTKPTIGFNVETLEFEDKNYTFWDVGGSESIRILWKFYNKNKAAVVFVVDASNSERFALAKDFLHTVMSDEDLSNAMLLVVANKQDKPNCVSDEDLKQQLDLKSLKRPCSLISTSAFDRESLTNIMVQLRDMNLF